MTILALFLLSYRLKNSYVCTLRACLHHQRVVALALEVLNYRNQASFSLNLVDPFPFCTSLSVFEILIQLCNCDKKICGISWGS